MRPPAEAQTRPPLTAAQRAALLRLATVLRRIAQRRRAQQQEGNRDA
jgi:hypothetical protein